MKKTAKVVWMAMAITAFSFNLSATEPTLQEAVSLFQKGEYEKAVPVFIAEADKGNARAQNALGYCYYTGYGATKNYKLAAELFTKSANQGYPMAQRMIGTMYYYGYSVEKNYTKAKEWLSKAAKQNDEDSKELLELIKKKEQPAPKTIYWEVLENGSRVEIKYKVDKISITVSYHGANQEIGNIWLSCHEGEKFNLLINSMNEIKNRFKTIKELNSFLLKYHNEFFYTYRESELIEVIKKYSPARKTITF